MAVKTDKDESEDRGTGNSSATTAAKEATAAKPKYTADDKLFTNLIDNLVKVGQTSATTAGGIKMLGDNAVPAAKAFGAVAEKMNGISFGLSGLAQTAFDNIEDQRVKVNKAGQQGLAGGDQTGYLAQMARTRMTTEQYLDMMAKQSVALQGLGKNADESGKTLSELTQQTRDSKLGKQLEAYGITLDGQYAKLQALGSMYTKENLQGKEGEENRKKLSEANAELAKELQLSANATGRNRQEIETEIENRLKESKYSAAMQGMNEDQRKNFIRTQAQVSVFGKSAEDLAATIAIGGRKTEEQQNYLMSMGPKAAREFERAAQLSASKDEESRKVGRAMMQKALADAADYRQNDPQFRRQIALGGPLADTFAKAQEEDRISQRIAQAKRDSGGTLTNQQAYNQVMRDAKFERSKEDNKQSTQIAGNAAQNAGLNAAQKVAEGLDDAFAKGAGTKVAKAINTYSDAVYGSGKAADAAKEYVEKFIKVITGTSGSALPNVTSDGKKVPNAGTMPTRQSVEEDRKKNTVPASPVTAPATTTPSPATTTPTTAQPVPNAGTMPTRPTTNTTAPAPKPLASAPSTKPTTASPTPNAGTMPTAPGSWWERNAPSWLGGAANPVSRAHTTLGVTGSLIDDFSSNGTPVIAHQGEGVTNLEQLSNLAKGSKTIGMTDGIKMASGMFEGLKTKISAINAPQPTYNPNEFVNSALRTAIETPKISEPTVTTQPQQTVATTLDSVGLKDLNDQLMRLNTGIMQLVQHSAKTIDLNQAQIKATKSLSGNKFA